MNKMTKIALVTAGLFSAGALTACQSTAPSKGADAPQRMHGERQMHKMTPEQREQIQQKRAERQEVMQQIRQACDGKTAGQSVQIKAGDKSIDGTCQTVFKADHKKRDAERPQAGERHHMKMHDRSAHGMNRGEVLTDAKRAELTKAYDQRLAERQARQQAILKACEGQSNGKAVQIKVGTQTVDGKCEVRFQPAPAAVAQAKAA